MKINKHVLRRIVLEEERKLLQKQKQPVIQEGILDFIVGVFALLFGFVFKGFDSGQSQTTTRIGSNTGKYWTTAQSNLGIEEDIEITQIRKQGKFLSDEEGELVLEYLAIMARDIFDDPWLKEMKKMSDNQKFWGPANPSDSVDVKSFQAGEGEYKQGKEAVDILCASQGMATAYVETIESFSKHFKAWKPKSFDEQGLKKAKKFLQDARSDELSVVAENMASWWYFSFPFISDFVASIQNASKELKKSKAIKNLAKVRPSGDDSADNDFYSAMININSYIEGLPKENIPDEKSLRKNLKQYVDAKKGTWIPVGNDINLAATIYLQATCNLVGKIAYPKAEPKEQKKSTEALQNKIISTYKKWLDGEEDDESFARTVDAIFANEPNRIKAKGFGANFVNEYNTQAAKLGKQLIKKLESFEDFDAFEKGYSKLIQTIKGKKAADAAVAQFQEFTKIVEENKDKLEDIIEAKDQLANGGPVSELISTAGAEEGSEENARYYALQLANKLFGEGEDSGDAEIKFSGDAKKIMKQAEVDAFLKTYFGINKGRDQNDNWVGQSKLLVKGLADLKLLKIENRVIDDMRSILLEDVADDLLRQIQSYEPDDKLVARIQKDIEKDEVKQFLEKEFGEATDSEEYTEESAMDAIIKFLDERDADIDVESVDEFGNDLSDLADEHPEIEDVFEKYLSKLGDDYKPFLQKVLDKIAEGADTEEEYTEESAIKAIIDFLDERDAELDLEGDNPVATLKDDITDLAKEEEEIKKIFTSFIDGLDNQDEFFKNLLAEIEGLEDGEDTESPVDALDQAVKNSSPLDNEIIKALQNQQEWDDWKAELEDINVPSVDLSLDLPKGEDDTIWTDPAGKEYTGKDLFTIDLPNQESVLAVKSDDGAIPIPQEDVEEIQQDASEETEEIPPPEQMVDTSTDQKAIKKITMSVEDFSKAYEKATGDKGYAGKTMAKRRAKWEKRGKKATDLPFKGKAIPLATALANLQALQLEVHDYETSLLLEDIVEKIYDTLSNKGPAGRLKTDLNPEKGDQNLISWLRDTWPEEEDEGNSEELKKELGNILETAQKEIKENLENVSDEVKEKLLEMTSEFLENLTKILPGEEAAWEPDDAAFNFAEARDAWKKDLAEKSGANEEELKIIGEWLKTNSITDPLKEVMTSAFVKNEAIRRLVRNILLEDKKKGLREEIARSRQTVDNDPVQYDDNDNVKVEMYANDMGSWSVKVDCTTDASLSYPLQRFPDEASANHYARQCCDRIVRRTMNESYINEGIFKWLGDMFGKFTAALGKSIQKVSKEYNQKITNNAEGNIMDEAMDFAGISSPNNATELTLKDPKQRRAWVHWNYGLMKIYEKTRQEQSDTYDDLNDPEWYNPEAHIEGYDKPGEHIKDVFENISTGAGMWISLAEQSYSSRFRPELKSLYEKATQMTRMENPGSLIKGTIEILEEFIRVFTDIDVEGMDKQKSFIVKVMNSYKSIYQAKGKAIAAAAKENQQEARQLVRNMLIEALSDDLANVTTGREAKKAFAKYVDQHEFKKGMLVHWVGSTRSLKKIIENPRTKDEISCNFYPNGGHKDWMAMGPKDPIGVIVQGYVTYAGKENMFTGFAKRPRKKAARAAYDHRKASSGVNKYPYQILADDNEMKKGHGFPANEKEYLDKLRNPKVPKTLASEMEPKGPNRELGEDSWMFGLSMGAPLEKHQDWNEVLVDNWKIVGIAYGAVGRFGLSKRQVESIKEIARQYGLKAYKIGNMS